ncbi:YlaH-like family protein [Paenibacillus xerothermodurans]|uniref:YlaH-like protein n=1 Tax=Paenibacillus xerothermodurans TaxID=1977292 RepID=A0A2W1NY71_PAEXE|nr:YlaH-like family protein [Paenibacillus xerothermodurans]PZE22676.1 hypothetical protein CBW46_002595 [Paenibacillus xerothermodurans]
MTAWLQAHPYIAYVMIYVLITYVYNKVFKTRRLPVLKEAIIYILLGGGSLMLLMFQMWGLPIVPSLAVAVALMLMVKIRYFVQDRMNKKQ